MCELTEKTPLLNNLHNIIEYGNIVLEINNKYEEIVEIITNNYTYNCKFIIYCTNSNRSIIIGNSINGVILKIYKTNISLPLKINWFMIKY